MNKSFYQFYIEMTGWQSYNWAVGASIPSVNLSGTISPNTDDSNFLRGAYGNYDQPKDPTMTGFKSFVKKDLEKYANNMDLPYIIKKGKIKHINNKLNPVFIFLSDGTRLYIPYHAYRTLGKPKKGQMLKVTLQRNQKDKSVNPSNIQKIELI